MKNDNSGQTASASLEKANLVYKFVMLYRHYMSESHDYGTGELANMVEVHTLTMIVENPGICVPELAAVWRRSNSALSQTTARLERKGYITRQRDPDNGRCVHLQPTAKGQALSDAHKAYDAATVESTLEDLSHCCRTRDIEKFFKVMECYVKLLEE